MHFNQVASVLETNYNYKVNTVISLGYRATDFVPNKFNVSLKLHH